MGSVPRDKVIVPESPFGFSSTMSVSISVLPAGGCEAVNTCVAPGLVAAWTRNAVSAPPAISAVRAGGVAALGGAVVGGVAPPPPPAFFAEFAADAADPAAFFAAL